MSPLSRMHDSRDDWKLKNRIKRKKINQLNRKVTNLEARTKRKDEMQSNQKESSEVAKELQRLADENRQQKEKIRRLEDENNRKQQEIERLEKETEKLQEELESKRLSTALSSRVICVYLLVTCGVSFRSISKVLRALIDLGILRDLWVPHFTSVINWSLRLGVNLLQIQEIKEPWIAIMDTSIDIGVCKAVVILRVRLSALGDRGSAITLQDCQVIFLRILTSSSGESIADCLEVAFSKAGRPIAILKNGGKDLQKDARI